MKGIKIIICICVYCIIFFLTANAQMYEKKDFYPGVREIYRRGYSSSAGDGWWTTYKLDEKGRVVYQENHFRRELRAKYQYEYNSYDDKILQISLAVRKSDQNDTIRNNYQYENGRISRQGTIFSGDTIEHLVFELLDSKGHSIFEYKRIMYRKARDNDSVEIASEELHTLKYNSLNQLIENVIWDPKDDSKIIVTYEYYPTGKLKRCFTKYIPYQEVFGVGGPFGADMFYEYIYDRKGRVKREYVTVDGKKKYKLAVYKYY